MSRTLIANLGESPVVIAALARALAQAGRPLDRLEVLYPETPGERWVVEGYRMLAAQLGPSLPVVGEPLPFADAATPADCLAYLRRLCERLEQHEQSGGEVILGISGGRKHTSALMAVPAIFYSCVAGVVHLHDREEGREGSRVPAHRLYELGEAQRAAAFSPPAERFTLVELPYARLSDGPALRRWLGGAEQGERPPPVPLSPRARAFYGELFGGRAARGDAAEAQPDAGRPLELIAPLGDSPMVVTQACALLAARGHTLSGVRVVYPRGNGAIAAGAQLLSQVCRRRGVPVELVPVAIADLSGAETVGPFQEGMRAAVAAARAGRPGAEPALLLAGGRKGMAALALAVAQAAGIQRAYHTTIPSPAREAEVVRAYEQAEGGPYAPLGRLMFLDGAGLDDFALIEVPVVPLAPA